MTTDEARLASEPRGYGVTTSIERLAADLAAARMRLDRATTRLDDAESVTAATDADAVRAEMTTGPRCIAACLYRRDRKRYQRPRSGRHTNGSSHLRQTALPRGTIL